MASFDTGGMYVAQWSVFADLAALDVHDLLKLRQDVFVLEQACLFAEIDGADPCALHLLVRARADGSLAGALRLFRAAVEDGDARIGRVVVSSAHRGTGLGRLMMCAGIERARQEAPRCSILLSGQAHLQAFYEGLGFVSTSDLYLEDDIPHVDMVLPAR